MEQFTPRPFLEALRLALEKKPMAPDDRTYVLKKMVPYAYAVDALLRLFDHADALLVVADLDGRIRRVNPAFTRALGHAPEDLNGKPLLDFVHPSDKPITLSKFEKLGSGLDVLRFENRWRTADGGWLRLSWMCPAPPEGTTELFAMARLAADPAQGP